MPLTTTDSLSGKNRGKPFQCVKCKEKVSFVVYVDGQGDTCQKCAPPRLVLGGPPE